MYSEKTARQITDKILARLVEETDITATSPGSVARTLTELIAQELGSAYSFMTSSLQQAFISTAGGGALDRLAAIFNITRKTVTPIVNSQSGALYFYLTKEDEDVIPGTATEVATTNVVIPAGTIIGCDPLRLGSDNPDLFRTTQQVTIPAGSYMVYVEAEPINSVKQTIQVGAAKYHNFTPAEAPVNATNEPLAIRAYNRAELQVDRFVESDTNLRYRIVNAISGTTGATEAALRLAALGVNGVRDCKVYPKAYGIGTAKVVVVLERPRGDDALSIFQAATTAVQNKSAVGDMISVMRPLESSVDMTISIVFKNGENDSNLATKATEAARAYINSMSVGDTFSVSRLYGIITSLSPRIVDAKIVDGSFMVDARPVPVTDYVCSSNQQLFATTDVVAK